MRTHSLASIKREIKSLKKKVSPESICLTFIESTDDPHVFKISETLYRSRADPIYKVREVNAATMEEVADQYTFPEGADPVKSVVFLHDYGDWENDDEEL